MTTSKYICVLVLYLSWAGKIEAQIKLQHIDFQYFHKSFQMLSFPFALDEKEVIEKTVREEYTRINQHHAETFLGISYQPFLQNSAEVPEKVPHFVGAFTTNSGYHVVIYYWFAFPAKREVNDNFELVIFDRKGGKQASKVIAGVWGEDKQFATLHEAGKEYIIETIRYTNHIPHKITYKITENGSIIQQ